MTDIIAQLEEMANSKKHYSDRLREERENYIKASGQFANQVTPNDMFTGQGGTPLAPSQVSASKRSLIDQIASEAGQWDNQALANDSQRIDLLKTLAGAQGNVMSNTPEGVQSAIASLTKGEKTPINNYTAVLARLQSLKNQLEGLGGTDSMWGSMVKGVTGPLSSTLGKFGSNIDRERFRIDLDTFQDEIRKDLFGSAFTDTEKKVAKLPGSGKQESTNKQILNSLYDQKLRQLRIEMANTGFNDAQIDMYLQSQGITPMQQQGAGQAGQQAVEYAFDAEKLLDDMGFK